MEKRLYEAYVRILKKELVPALGCTEPIALAFAAAKARDVLGCFPEHLHARCSGNIIKNVKGVTVPNSGGRKGIEIAVILGCVGGNAAQELKVLEGVTKQQQEEAFRLAQQGFCTCSLKEGVANLYVEIEAKAGDHVATVIVAKRHNQVTKIIKDGEILFEKDVEMETQDGDISLTVRDILEFANTVKMEDIEESLDRQIECNSAISREGLNGEYGEQVGRTLLDCYDEKDIKVRARAVAAAGSDARMGGCALPVIIISGSGNQGMAASLPVLEYAKELGADKEKTCRALCVSNLIAMEQKRCIGPLSAYCGAVCAACGAGAAITYLSGGDCEMVENTIVNTLANAGGIVCDGAKPSCAAKIATAVDAAILGHSMAMKGRVFRPGDGLVQSDAEKTIEAFGRVGKVGMKETDIEILNIMLGN